MAYYSPPPCLDSERSTKLAWAMNAHLYDGMCPDDVEGWAVRDPACLACYTLDLMLSGSGAGEKPEAPEVPWDALSHDMVQQTLTVGLVLVETCAPVEFFAALARVALFSSKRRVAYRVLNHLEDRAQDSFAENPELIELWASFAGQMLLLAEGAEEELV